jgi:alpha-amylase
MKSVCLYFQVHQPFRLRTYRFFDIGHQHDYFDEFTNRYIIRQVADKCYLPTNEILLEQIKKLIKNFGFHFQYFRIAPLSSLKCMPLKYWIVSVIWPKQVR